MPPRQTDAPAAADAPETDAGAAAAPEADAVAGVVGEAQADPDVPKAPEAQSTEPDAPAAADAPLDPATQVPAAEQSPSRADPASLGLARVKHPQGASSCSVGGQSYEADDEGVITVPLVAVDELTSHGFELV